MFDAATAELIRSAPALSGVDPLTLPQELTRIYSDLVVLRLKGAALADDLDQLQILQRLKRIADVYEGAVDTGTDGNSRRGAAFVAATAHQFLGRVFATGYEAGQTLLEPDAIHPSIAAPLLFLVAEQNADAREAARPLSGIRIENRLRSAVIESIFDLATERFESILERAARLRRARVMPTAFGSRRQPTRCTGCAGLELSSSFHASLASRSHNLSFCGSTHPSRPLNRWSHSRLSILALKSLALTLSLPLLALAT